MSARLSKVIVVGASSGIGEAMARQLLVYPGGGTIDGARGDHVLLAPPFIIDAAAIDQVVERLGDAIDAATDHSGR